MVYRNSYVCTFLDQNDSIVEMFLEKSDTKWSISVDILALELGTPLQDIE